jgi:hypothetical protein
MALGVLAAANPAHAETPTTHRHALVVTNNKSLSLGRADLHYADDDGLKWAELFAALSPTGTTALLTTIDGPTQLFWPNAAPAAPTRDNVIAALNSLAETMRQTPGDDTLTVVFAGHGDIAGGEGFLELEDGRLTATDLERLLSAVPATRIHLIIDACNAYFMLHPRKPGARTVTRTAEPGLLDRHPHIGALLSTSAEALSWEWSEIQSGLFSHALRSGLRGGADLDRNGAITYRELEGFLTIAHKALPDGFKPRLFVRAPKTDAELPVANLPTSDLTRQLTLATTRHLAITDNRGVRLFEGHFEAGATLPLVLPLGPLHVTERVGPTGTTPRRAVYEGTTPLGPVMTTAGTDTDEARARGDHRLEAMFSTPFGPDSFAKWEGEPVPEPAPYGVSTQDVARLGSVLATGARFERTSRRTSGVVMLGIGALTGGIAIGAALDENSFGDKDVLVPLLGSAAGLAIISGAVSLATTGTLEDLHASYAALELTTELERADAVARFERDLKERAADYRQVRELTGWVSLLGGAALTGLAIYTASNEDNFNADHGLSLGSGLLIMGFGAYSLTGMRHNVEELWDLYQDLRELPWAPGESPKVTLTPLLAPVQGGLSIGVGAAF